MADPLILQRIIDGYVRRLDHMTAAEFLKGISGGVGLMIAAALASRVAKNCQEYFVNLITQRVGVRLYNDGLRHSMQLPYEDFEDLSSGEALEKLQKARLDVERLLTLAVGLVFTTIVAIGFVLFYAARIHWAIGPAYLLTMPVLGWLSSLLTRRVRSMRRKILAETTALAGTTTESLRNIELVKGLGLARQEIERLESTTEKIMELELSKMRFLRRQGFIQGAILTLVRSSIIFLMMCLMFLHRVSLGEFTSLFIYSFLIFGPLQEMGYVLVSYHEAEASLASFEELMAMRTERAPANAVTVSDLASLEFQDVVFRHKTASKPALRGVSFQARRGETIAFAGPSGAGKSTLVKVLVGLYQPGSGEVRYNGTPGARIDFDDLRSRLGLVTQETQLFAASIRENLLFGRHDASDDECLRVLRQAAGSTLLDRGGQGLDTLIGEGGVKVSGGEKQRLSIARALLRQPQMLVFDEATSSLDSQTEEEISHTIRTIGSGRDAITVLVAHRLSTLMHADRIYVMDQGLIVESGRHENLVERGGLYAAMWRQQVGDTTAVAV